MMTLVIMGGYVFGFIPVACWLGHKRHQAKTVEQIALEDAEQVAALRRQRAHPGIAADFADRLRG